MDGTPTASGRAQIYAVSPAFRELQPALEDLNSGWFTYGCLSYPHTCGDLTGGWFLWAVRDAVTRSGYHSTAANAAAYYLRLADEINAACESGRLDCDSPRETLVDPLRWYHIEHLPGAVTAAFARTLEFSDVHILTAPCSPLDSALMRLYEDMTHHAFQAPSRLPAGCGIEISSEILAEYQWVVPRLAVVAGLGYLASLWPWCGS
jgi:hypothetical protein